MGRFNFGLPDQQTQTKSTNRFTFGLDKPAPTASNQPKDVVQGPSPGYSYQPKTSQPKQTQGMGDLRQFESTQTMEAPKSWANPYDNVPDDWELEHPTFTKYARDFGSDMDKIFKQPFVQRSGQAGSEIITGQNMDKPSTGSKGGDVAADLLGGIMGFTTNPGSSTANIGKSVFNTGAKATQYLPDLAKGGKSQAGNIAKTAAADIGGASVAKTPSLGRDALGLAGGSVAHGATTSIGNDEPISGRDLAISAGANAAIGAATHGAVKGYDLLKKPKAKTPEVNSAEIKSQTTGPITTQLAPETVPQTQPRPKLVRPETKQQPKPESAQKPKIEQPIQKPVENVNKTEPWQYTKQQLKDGELPSFKLDTGLNKYELERAIIPGQKPKYNRKTKSYEMVDDSEVSFIQKGTNSAKNIDVLHKKSVEQAIKEGKYVPPEVLKEYPDLQAKVSEPPRIEVPQTKLQPEIQQTKGYPIKTEKLSENKYGDVSKWDEQSYQATIKALESENNEKLDALIKAYTEYKPKGVEQGGIGRDEYGEVVARWGRTSRNEPWYQAAYEKYGHKPTKAELKDFAIEELRYGRVSKAEGEIPPDVNFVRNEQDISNLKNLRQFPAKTEKTQLKTEPPKLEAPKQPKLTTLSVPEKMEPLGNGQKARSFPISTIKSPMTKDEVKKGVLKEVKPEGKGAYKPVKLKDVDQQAKDLVNSDSEKALTFVMNEKEPSALHTATGVRLIEKYQNEGNYERAIDVSMSLAEKLTKQGQATSAARLMSSLSPEGVLTFASRQIQKINNEPKIKLPKLGIGKDVELAPETAENLKRLTEALKNTTDRDLKIELSQELQSALNALKPSSLGRKLSVGQTIAQLWNPKTQVRNSLGNEIFYRLERANKYVATPVDWAKSKLTGSERTVTFKTGSGTYWQDFFTGVKDYGKGFKKGASAGWRGVNPEGIETRYDLGHGLAFNPKGNWASKTMSFLERSLGASIRGFDHAAYARAKNQTIGELANLRAINETGKADKALVEKYMREADDNVLNIADQYGKYVTFQDNNVISNALVGVKRTLNKPTGGDFGLGDLILKYPKTPGALVARGLDYSPAGFLKSAYEVAKPILQGKSVNSRDVTMSLSRAITGTAGLTGLGYFLADKGILTGSASKDKDVRALQQQTGEGPYRVNGTALERWVKSGFDAEAAEKRKGDLMVTYDWAQPVAMSLAMGANIHKTGSAEGIQSASTLAMDGLTGSLNTVAEQPVLQGLQRLTTSYPGESGSDKIGGALSETAKQIPSSFTPTLLNQFRQLSDNTGRSTYDPSLQKEALNKAKLKIPGLSSTLPTAYDTLGKPKENYQGGSNNAFNTFLNPSFVSRYNPSPEAEKAINIFDKTGDTRQIPRAVNKSITMDGVKYELTAEEYSEYQSLVGTFTKAGFAKISANNSLEKQTAEMIKVMNEANAYAKEKIIARRQKK